MRLISIQFPGQLLMTASCLKSNKGYHLQRLAQFSTKTSLSTLDSQLMFGDQPVYNTGIDVSSGAALNMLFTGIAVDVAVRDNDAWLYRVSYHITLLGKIVFRQDRILTEKGVRFIFSCLWEPVPRAREQSCRLSRPNKAL